MIVVELRGGLANQLFQFAFGRHLAKQNNTELYFDCSWYKGKEATPGRPLSIREQLEIKHYKSYTWLKYLRQYNEVQFHFEQRAYDLGDNYYVTGYWQSLKYFHDVQDEMKAIRNGLHFQYLKESIKLYGMEDWTAIHVRRGDFLTNRGCYALPTEYYRNAMEIFGTKKFVVFTDDPEYCKKVFPDGKLIQGNAWNDMIFISFFPKIIMANSTFSWWSAFFSEAEVITPARWFAHPTHNTNDLYLDSWRRL